MNFEDLDNEDLRRMADVLHYRTDNRFLTYPTQGEFLRFLADEANTELARRHIAARETSE